MKILLKRITGREKHYNIVLRDQIINDYSPLIKSIAFHFAARLPASVELDDLVSVATIGLMDAIEKYDPMQNTSFKNYATYRIRGSILDELRSLDSISRSTRKKVKALERAQICVEKRTKRAASQAELRTELNLSSSDFHTLRGEAIRPNIISLDQPTTRQQLPMGTLLKEAIPDHNYQSPHVTLAQKELKTLLKDAIQKLPTNQRLTLCLYYYENLTLKEISEILTLTEPRICQLHQQAVKKLKELMNQAQKRAWEMAA